MRTLLSALITLVAVSCVASEDPAEREPPACEITVARPGGAITIDVVSRCTGDDWMLEYRLLSSGVVATNRRDFPCGSTTHVEVLQSAPALADMTAVGWLYNADQRSDCYASTVAE